MINSKGKATGFGIIGCGIISAVHATAINHHPWATLVALCDIDQTKAECLQHQFPADKIYIDYRELLADSAVDVVCVCTPSYLHGEISIAAARAGKHVFVEKPMDILPETIDQMIQVCREQQVKLGCVFQLRTRQTLIKVRQAVRLGMLGRIIMADATMKYYRDQNYYDSADWRGTWAYDGGGALMNQCIHGLDLLIWIVGDVQSVMAKTATQVHQIDVEDTAAAVLSFHNGAIGVVRGTTSVRPGQEMLLEIHGEKGSIVCTDSVIRQWSVCDQTELSANSSTETANRVSGVQSDPTQLTFEGHYQQIDDLIRAIHSGCDPMVSGEEGRKAIDLIHAIYRSSREGRSVVLNRNDPAL